MIQEAHRLEAWGKLSPDTATTSVSDRPMHPLCDHMLDVASCFIAIVREGTRLRDALRTTAKRVLTAKDIERLAVLAYLHDFGKANSGFQSKRWKDTPPRAWPRPAGHGAEALIVLKDDALFATLPLEAISDWGESAYRLLLASLAHHGRPIDDSRSPDPRIWNPVIDGEYPYAPADALTTIGKRLLEDFPLAFEPGGDPLPSTPQFAHLFAGLIQLADWLGSDTRFFKYSDPGTQRTRSQADRLAADATKSIGLDVCLRRVQLSERTPSFEAAFNVPAPHPVQSALGEDGLGPLLILESETGSGKTEAALWRFLHLFKAGKVDSLYFALPTRVAAVQVYERVRQFVARVWPDEAPVVVRALSGYESADGNDKIALPDFKVQWSDSPDDIKAPTRWAAESPKRFLAATIAVGTIDQALLAGLMVRHAHLRHALLTRALLVVDEVHASDTYMSQLLENVLEAHLDAGGHALLLSATLGSRQRARFQRIARRAEEAEEISLDEACATHYPALTDDKGVLELPKSGPKKKIYWQTLPLVDDHERVARLAADAARQAARVLIVRNTVSAAIATQKALERIVDESGERAWLFHVNGVVTLHHSRFSRQDRPLLDAEVEERLGRERDGPHAAIVIGTQTLEQSLDIDADLLITDICPMDVLLQRLGRLHRHERKYGGRPEAYHEPRALVLTPERHSFESYLQKPRNGLGRFRDGGGVYPDLRMIEATWRLIDETDIRVIPDDNRKLVERATHRECLEALEKDLGKAWETLGQQLEGTRGAQRTVAHMHTLRFDKPFDEIKFPEKDQHIATRLGTADRLIEFDPPVRGPFGSDVIRMAMPHHLLFDVASVDAQPSAIAQDDKSIEFSLDAVRFRYSRFGIERA